MDLAHVYTLIIAQLVREGHRLEMKFPSRLEFVYEDQRMYIYEEMDAGTETTTYVLVALKTPEANLILGEPQKESESPMPKTLAIGKSPDARNWTLVYEKLGKKGQLVFFRPGKWIDWLQAQADQEQQYMEKRQAFHGVPVDDGDLFK